MVTKKQVEPDFHKRLANAKKIVKEYQKARRDMYTEFRRIVPIHAKPASKPTKKPMPVIVKTLDDLKQIKELKDQVEALKARITRKDVTIKSLKRRIEKLKNPIEKKKKEEETNFYVDNPDFLEIV